MYVLASLPHIHTNQDWIIINLQDSSQTNKHQDEDKNKLVRA